MYQADFICTYKWMDDPEDQEQMYRIQLLQAFDLNEWNDDKINTTIQEIYTALAKTDELKNIYKKARQNTFIMETLSLFSHETVIGDDIIFNLLFKFEYFDLLHRCIVDFLINGNVDEIYATKLLNAL
jgi:hypothetical protein